MHMYILICHQSNHSGTHQLC